MRVGILGTGDVGRALGKAFIALGNEVKLGARDANNAKANAWVQETGPNASAGTFADAAAFGEIVVVATLGMAAESAITMASIANRTGKVVIDTTNPLDHSTGTLRLAIAGYATGTVTMATVPVAEPWVPAFAGMAKWMRNCIRSRAGRKSERDAHSNSWLSLVSHDDVESRSRRIHSHPSLRGAD